MKKFILTLLIATIALGVMIVYERFFVQSQFGPSSILAVAGLTFFALALFITLVSIDTRFQELVSRIWMVSISIAVTFILSDLLAGYLLIKPLSPELSPDKIRHHKLVANTYSRFEQPDFSYIQRVNNLGLRGKDTTLEKPDKHFRILMLGDSFTMGKGVEDDQTFSVILEDLLNKNKPCNDSRIEVLNGGTDSYAPILSYLQLKTDLVALEPDLVVLNLDVSDLLQESAYRNEAVLDERGEVQAVPGSERPVLLNQRIRRWIDQNLFFTRLILFYTNKLFGYKDLSVQGVVTRANSEIVEYTLSQDTENREKQWQAIFDSIAKINNFAAERSITFSLAVYPWGHQVNEKEWAPGRYNFMTEEATASDDYLDTVTQHSADSSIDLINLFSHFRSYQGNEPLYFNYDMHWTTEGHKVMASGLARHLNDRYSKIWCEH